MGSSRACIRRRSLHLVLEWNTVLLCVAYAYQAIRLHAD